jgi:hypothetical protein
VSLLGLRRAQLTGIDRGRGAHDPVLVGEVVECQALHTSEPATQESRQDPTTKATGEVGNEAMVEHGSSIRRIYLVAQVHMNPHHDVVLDGVWLKRADLGTAVYVKPEHPGLADHNVSALQSLRSVS